MKIVGIITMVDGTDVELDVTKLCSSYFISGSPTLTGNWSLSTTGTPVQGAEVIVDYAATPTVSTYTVSIMGLVIPTHLATKKLHAVARYNGTSWDTIVTFSVDQSNIIIGTQIKAGELDNTHIASDADIDISKLKGTASGSILLVDPVTGIVSESGFTEDEADLLIGLTADSTDLNLLDGASTAGLTADDLAAIAGIDDVFEISGDNVSIKAGKTFVVNGNINKVGVRHITADETLTITDSLVIVSLSADTEITLPAGIKGQEFEIRIHSNPTSTHDITIQCDGSESVSHNGAADANSATIATITAGTVIKLICYATGYWSMAS